MTEAHPLPEDELAEIERRFRDAMMASGYARLTALAKDAIPGLLSTVRAQREALEAGWRPIETAPRGEDVLVYWPRMALDDAGELTGKVLPDGYVSTSRNDHGGWEPDNVVEANGDWFGDDFEFGEPTLWHPIPPLPEALTLTNKEPTDER